MNKPPKLSELDQLHALGDAKQRGGGGNISRINRNISSSSNNNSNVYTSTSPSNGIERITVRIPTSSSSSSTNAIRNYPPIEKTAAMGHKANDAYMRDWERAYAELEASSSSSNTYSQDRIITNKGGTSSSRISSAGSTNSNGKGPYHSYGNGNSATNSTISKNNTTTIPVRKIGNSSSTTTSSSSTSASRIISSTTSISVLDDENNNHASSTIRQSTSSLLSSSTSDYLPLTNIQWSKGPLDPAGRLIDLSDRPNLCMAINRQINEAVIGSSDHALYTIDVRNGRLSRRLYGGKYGHTEWVTSVCYVGNRVVSSGMDGKICVWGSSTNTSTNRAAVSKQATCTDLVGHFGSVSLVASPGGGTNACGPSTNNNLWNQYIVSGGYDKTVRLWDCNKGSCLMTAKSHQAPVLCAALLAKDTTFYGITGDRDGIANIWRFHDQISDGTLKGHRGHLTACTWIPGDNSLDNDADVASGSTIGNADLAVTGAQDGHIRIWDLRDSKTCIGNVIAHASNQGSGAIGDLTIARIGTDGISETVLISSGADKRICVYDPRMNFQVRYTFTEHNDFIYSLTSAGNYCFSGSGDGLVYVHDLLSGRIKWGVGAGMAAIRNIGILSNKYMICTGDDGKAMIYDF